MKRNNFAVLMSAALLVLSSCHFFTGEQASVENPLLGNWKIDSIAPGGDSTKLGILLIAMALDDSAAYDLKFEKDTVTFIGKDYAPEKTPYAYIDSVKQIILLDSSDERFVITRLSDSTTTLQAKDSSIFFLKKK
jgi:hypothetical protein